MNPANRAKGNDEIYTPDWCVKDMVNHFNPTGTILEPCKGLGAFTDVLPNADWCEIRLVKISMIMKTEWTGSLLIHHILILENLYCIR